MASIKFFVTKEIAEGFAKKKRRAGYTATVSLTGPQHRLYHHTPRQKYAVVYGRRKR